MKLDVGFIKSVVTLYDELKSNGITLVFMGEFNHEITKMFTTMSERELGRKKEEPKITRKVYHVMVEILQNISKHSDEITGIENNIGNGLFLIGNKKSTYYIITSNKVSNDKIDDVQSALIQVNSLKKEELNELFKKTMKEGKISDKGGAGLGLIDIARKTGNKLEHTFLPLDEKYSLFILKVEISGT
ncbi:SiaB family protein kinase [Bacteroidota bacterium]